MCIKSEVIILKKALKIGTGTIGTEILDYVNLLKPCCLHIAVLLLIYKLSQQVVHELEGEFPDNRDSLMKQLPGVGRYSGSAVASIALGHCVGVVDGNVNRVLARVRGVGADISTQVIGYDTPRWMDEVCRINLGYYGC